MARPRKQKNPEPPAFHQAIRARFLYFGVRHSCRALQVLATEIWPTIRQELEASLLRVPKADEQYLWQERRPRRTKAVRRWTAAIYQGGKWLEQWAEDTLDYWRHSPRTAERLIYPLPRVGSEDDDFRFATKITPVSREQVGIVFGGDRNLWADVSSEELLRRNAREQLEAALDQYFASARERWGAVAIPKDLNLKIETAALYVLCGATRSDLAARLVATHTTEKTIWDWLSEVLPLLQLRMRPPGRRKV